MLVPPIARTSEFLLSTLRAQKIVPGIVTWWKISFALLKRDNRSVLLQALLRWALWVTCHAHKTVDTTACYRPIFFARGLNFQFVNTITIPRSILILHLNSTNNNTTLIYTFLAFTDSTYVVPTPTHRQPSAGIFLSFVHSWHICTVLTPTIFCRILSLTAHTSFRHRHTDNRLSSAGIFLSFVHSWHICTVPTPTIFCRILFCIHWY